MLSFIKNLVSKCIHGLSQSEIHDEKLKNENGKLKWLTAVSKPWSFFFLFLLGSVPLLVSLHFQHWGIFTLLCFIHRTDQHHKKLVGIYLLETKPLNETKTKPIRYFTKPIRHFPKPIRHLENERETRPSELCYWTKTSGTLIGDMEENLANSWSARAQ